MSQDLRLLNHRRAPAVDARLLRQLARALLVEFLHVEQFDLTIQLVGAHRMAQLNETILDHQGATDVITLDYSDANPSAAMVGEIFICLDEARAQARIFRATWQTELIRYLVHAILHLQGYDDRNPSARRRMKSAEDRLLRKLARRFRLSKLERKPRMAR